MPEEEVAKSLEDSIGEAFGDGEESPDETSEEETEEQTEDTDDSEEEENTEESDDEESEEDPKDVFSTDLSNEDLARAEKIFKSLNGPDAIEYFKFLADRAGYELVDKEPKTEKASGDTIGDLDEVLSKVLGDNYKFLDTKVINAIKAYDAVVAKKFEQLEAKDASKAEETAKAEAANVIKGRLTAFGKKHNLSFDEGKGDDITEEMNVIAKRLPFTGESVEDFDEYLSVIHTAAIAKVSKTANKVRKINKINQNLEDSEAESVKTGDKTTRRGPARPSLDEALQAAIGSDGIFEE